MTDKLSRLLLLLEEQRDAVRYNKLARMYPDDGALRRELYPKHLECFAAGAECRERGFMGGNGVGKTEGVLAYEAALHLTGLYPDWWPGRRFDGPIDSWLCGNTHETTRDIIQKKVFGDFAKYGEEALGTGTVPRHCIGKKHPRPNGGGALDWVQVRHVSGGWSVAGFKAYEQGRTSFEGTEKHFVGVDEEAPKDCYGEMVARGRMVNGLVLATFTPLKGLTPLVRDFMNVDGERDRGRSMHVVHCDMDDVPHLSDKDKREILAAFPKYQHKARKSGFPIVGEGLIYAVDEDQFVVAPFPLSPHFKRAFGFDYGVKNTAALWGAYDEDTDTLYVYSEYKEGEHFPIDVHATRMKARGAWIPGVGDSSARESDGKQVITKYRQAGVRMKLPNKSSGSVGAGIDAVLARLVSGRLKIFSTCAKTLAEIRQYRREEREGKFSSGIEIVKKDDHLMDSLRYLVVDGLKIATTQHVAGIELEQVRFG